jgi:hypothetical protein
VIKYERVGNPNNEKLAQAFVRYDVVTETCYVIVISLDGAPIEKKANEAWVSMNDVNNKVINGNSPNFKWVPKPGSTPQVIG